MADEENIETSPTALLDQLVGLDPHQPRQIAATLRSVSGTFTEVPDGRTASHVLGVLAHLLDPA